MVILLCYLPYKIASQDTPHRLLLRWEESNQSKTEAQTSHRLKKDYANVFGRGRQISRDIQRVGVFGSLQRPMVIYSRHR